MKNINYILAACGVSALALGACTADAPFGKGEGYLKINSQIRSDVQVTRGDYGDFDVDALASNCVVYIEDNKGLLHKYKGIENIPSSIVLNTGSYVAEAWTGDSVSASYSSKFYRAYQKFEIAEGENTLSLNVNIANVIVSVNPEVLDAGISDLKITFGHSRGELEFTPANIESAKGYFMLPNADKDVWYRIEGKALDGSAIFKDGKIENAERAHEYVLRITNNYEQNEGGAWLRIEIEDIPVIEDNIDIFSRPALSSEDYDSEGQLIAKPGNFNDVVFYSRAFMGFSGFRIENVQGFENDPLFGEGLDIITCTDLRKNELHAAGIEWVINSSNDASTGKPVEELFLTFSKEYLDALAPAESEYVLKLVATDNQYNGGVHKSTELSFRIANTDDAIASPDPVVASPAPDKAANPMAITGSTAKLTGFLKDESATGYGIMYRAKGESAWNRVAADAPARMTRADGTSFTVSLSGLKPGTTYEYAVYADGFESKTIMTFVTESIFKIPNASFEDWDTYSAKTLLGTKNVTFPGISERTFWDSGNEGAATANKTLTNKSADMVHSGNYSARLASDKAVGVLAAGNIFTGTYVKTDGTNGVLSFGREYNGTHPTALKVYANYRPGTVDVIKSGNEEFIEVVNGGIDQGQIYVGLTTEPVEIRTNPDNRKLFNKDDECVVAYGQVTLKENYGPDGALAELVIPIEYNERAQTKAPTHIVIVVSASKFGDFFSGSSKSVFYLDDFELLYE